LEQVNQSLLDKGLPSLGAQDFQDTVWRTIFASWQSLAQTDTRPSTEKLNNCIPVDLQPQLEAILTADNPEMGKEELLRDLIRTVLRLREPVLAQRVQDLYALIRDVQGSESDQRAEYTITLRSYTATLRQVQKTLAET
jgi:hypothetical protein